MELKTVSESIKEAASITKLAKDLKVGDITSVGEKVVVAPSAGIKTPSGKIDLVVEYPNGKRVSKTWNKNTKIAVKSVNESAEPQKVNGTFYRVDSGFTHPRGATAKDVLDFEADELDNEDGKIGRENMEKAGVDLSKYPAKSIIWVTRDKKSAKRYKEEYGGQIEEIEIKNGIVVVEDDGDGGTLILRT